MTSAAQLRAARALLGLSQPEIAELTGLSTMTVKRAEGAGSPAPSDETVKKIRAALEAAGAVFLDSGEVREGGPGVRLKKRRDAK